MPSFDDRDPPPYPPYRTFEPTRSMPQPLYPPPSDGQDSGYPTFPPTVADMPARPPAWPATYPQDAPTLQHARIRPPGPPKRRHNTLYAFVGGIASALVIVCCLGILLVSAQNKPRTAPPTARTTPQPTATFTPAPTATPTRVPGRYYVGDTVTVDGTYVVTVNGVSTSKGGFFKPRKGNTFLIVDLTIRNISDQPQGISSWLQFALKDSTGQKRGETLVDNVNGPDGNLAPGDTVRGQIGYEVPRSQHDFSFSFQPNWFQPTVIVWLLSV